MDPSKSKYKPSKILDFSLLSLTCQAKKIDLELESENFKIYPEKLSPRSLHFRRVFRAAATFQFRFLESKIGIFGIFSSGDVEHPTYSLSRLLGHLACVGFVVLAAQVGPCQYVK